MNKNQTWKARRRKGRIHIRAEGSLVGVPVEVALIYQCSETDARTRLIEAAPTMRNLLASQPFERHKPSLLSAMPCCCCGCEWIREVGKLLASIDQPKPIE